MCCNLFMSIVVIIGHMNMTTIYEKLVGGYVIAIEKYHFKGMEQSWDLDLQKY